MEIFEKEVVQFWSIILKGKLILEPCRPSFHLILYGEKIKFEFLFQKFKFNFPAIQYEMKTGAVLVLTFL